ISALGAGRQWSQVTLLLKRMQDERFAPDKVTFNAAIGACARSRRWEEALAFAADLVRARLKADGVTVTGLITACGGAGEWERALDIFGWWNLQPNTISCNALLGAFEQSGCWEKALSLLAFMDAGRGQGRGSDSVSYSLTIGACGRGGRWDLSLWLLSELRCKTLMQTSEPTASPDPRRRWAVAYCSAVRACGASGQWEQALQVLREMRWEGMGQDRPTFNAAANVLRANGRWMLALGLLEEMQASRVSLDVEAYNEVMGSLLEAEHPERQWLQSLGLLDEVRKRHLSPTGDSYNAVIKVLEAAQKWAVARQLGDELHVLNLREADVLAPPGRVAPGLSERLLRHIARALFPAGSDSSRGITGTPRRKRESESESVVVLPESSAK
ncbi:unnamed protein product, partial [Polarella glacialis]